jgi:hypothetical protein
MEGKQNFKDTMMYVPVDNGDYENNAGEYIKKYMKVSKYCGNAPGDCFAQNYYEYRDNDKEDFDISEMAGACAILKNGIQLIGKDIRQFIYNVTHDRTGLFFKNNCVMLFRKPAISYGSIVKLNKSNFSILRNPNQYCTKCTVSHKKLFCINLGWNYYKIPFDYISGYYDSQYNTSLYNKIDYLYNTIDKCIDEEMKFKKDEINYSRFIYNEFHLPLPDTFIYYSEYNTFDKYMDPDNKKDFKDNKLFNLFKWLYGKPELPFSTEINDVSKLLPTT